MPADPVELNRQGPPLLKTQAGKNSPPMEAVCANSPERHGNRRRAVSGRLHRNSYRASCASRLPADCWKPGKLPQDCRKTSAAYAANPAKRSPRAP